MTNASTGENLPSSRFWRAVLLGGRILFCLIFGAAGVAKILGAPIMVSEFTLIGLGSGFRYFTGAVELVGAVLILVPRTVAFGAALLIWVCIGAFIAQWTIIKQDVVHTVVFAIALSLIGSPYRHQITRLISTRK